jgi:hypothetical protein
VLSAIKLPVRSNGVYATHAVKRRPRIRLTMWQRTRAAAVAAMETRGPFEIKKPRAGRGFFWPKASLDFFFLLLRETLSLQTESFWQVKIKSQRHSNDRGLSCVSHREMSSQERCFVLRKTKIPASLSQRSYCFVAGSCKLLSIRPDLRHAPKPQYATPCESLGE